MCSHGTHVVTGSWDKTLILWDIDRGEAVHQFEGHTEGTSSSKTQTSKVKRYMYIQFYPFISKTCVKWLISKRPKIGFQDQLLFNAGQKYCRMLQGEHLQ